MRSPIIHLQNQTAGAPFNVPPERACACKQYRDHNKIDFVLVDEIGFRVRVRPCAQNQTIEIVLPIASLEYLGTPEKGKCQVGSLLAKDSGMSRAQEPLSSVVQTGCFELPNLPEVDTEGTQHLPTA